MKIKKIMIAISIALSAPLALNAVADSATCGNTGRTLLSVADFDGDGSVTGRDISLLAKEVGKGGYYALYDRNADDVLDALDVTLATNDMGVSSTQTDQELAKMYQRFKHFQNIDGFDQIAAMGYQPVGGTIAFHGQHWTNSAGFSAIGGLRQADPDIAEGLNVAFGGTDIPALYWGQGSVPLFNDSNSPTGLSPLDWPQDPFGLNPTSAWISQPVQAFGSQPPDFFTDTSEDSWHAHAGLCLTLTDEGAGPHWNNNQHTTSEYCQSLPNLAKVDVSLVTTGVPGGPYVNLWGNFWMLHAWLYDLNPNGVFANTHPCIDPDAPSEDDINGGRVVPPFFQNHH